MTKITKVVDIINNSVSDFEGVKYYLSTGDLSVSKIDNLVPITYNDKPSRANLEVNVRDIILARMKGTIKVLVIDKENKDIIVSTGFIVLRPKQNVCSKYLFHIFMSNNFQVKKDELCSGATQKAINNSNFKKLEIPLPPLETQKQIAEILDNAAALRDKTQQLLTEYDALAQSIFLDMFGDPVTNPKNWSIKLVKNCSEKIQIGPFGSQLHKSDYVELGYSLINPTDIVGNKITEKESAKINKIKYSSLPNYHMKIGDIIMARRGDLSKIAVVHKEGLFCGTGSLFIRFKKEINRVFIFYCLRNESMLTRIYNKSRGITMANLNKKIIKDIEIPVPPIELQNEFAEKIALIEKQKELAKQELKESEDLFHALLQKAFKGELV